MGISSWNKYYLWFEYDIRLKVFSVAYVSKSILTTFDEKTQNADQPKRKCLMYYCIMSYLNKVIKQIYIMNVT